MKLLLNAIRNQRAETLAEVLIALIVISTGATAALAMVNQSIRANASNEERIVAYNIAREGVEAVRNIRDTNWFRFPGNRTDCWDVTLDTTDSTKCTSAAGATKIADGDYVIYAEVDDTTELFTWNLSPVTATTDTSVYQISLNGKTYYSHDPSGSLGYSQDTGFDRVITIQDKTSDDFKVTATVTWSDYGQDHEISFWDELTNY
jgi:Tfp pilus assembly protein PilV